MVRWMRAHAADLHVDPDCIVAMGSSAGAHLAMLAGYASDVALLEGNGGHAGVSSRPDLVIDMYGPTDATTPGLRDKALAVRFMGKRYDEDPDWYRLASPLHHLDATDPPTLVIHGDIDQLCPIAQSDALVERLREVGVPHYYARMRGWPHLLDLAPQCNGYVHELIDAFLAEHAEADTIAAARQAATPAKPDAA